MRGKPVSLRASLQVAPPLLTALCLLLSACTPGAEIPAPRLVQTDRSLGLSNGWFIDNLTYNLGWTTDLPLAAGEDLILLEILDASGAVAYSTTFSHAETSARFSALTSPEGTIDDRDAIHDFYLQCGETYSWHVRQMRGLQASPWSEEWTFTASPLESAILLVSPPDGGEILGGALEWINGSLFSGYAQIRLGEAPSDTLVPQRSPTRYTAGPLEIQSFYTLLPGHRYYWSVRKMSHYGCPGAWSPWWSFIWMGPPITGSPSGRLDGGLPAGSSMAGPVPICPVGECDTMDPPTPTSPAILPPEPLLPTAVVVLPTLTPPPAATDTLPPPSCSDFATLEKCESNGCYWWSSGFCKSIPEPQPPACSSYTDEISCTQASCTWDAAKDLCH